jgi:Ser/Thr protein kinase RdoA (MazF antagonist)
MVADKKAELISQSAISNQELVKLIGSNYGLSVTNIEPLSCRQWNTTYQVENNDAIFYLKQYRPKYREENIRCSHTIIHFVRERGYCQAIQYLPTQGGKLYFSGQRHFYELSKKITGVQYPMYCPTCTHHLLPTIAMGLARLHCISTQVERVMPPAWPYSVHLDECTQKMLSHSELRWACLGPEERKGREILCRAIVFLQEKSEQFNIPDLRRETGIAVHGDFTLKNLLFCEMQIVGVVDWESANIFELPLYDILKSAASFFSSPLYDEEVVTAFLNAYTKVRNVTDYHTTLMFAMWVFLHLKWILKLLSAITDEADRQRLCRSLEILRRELARASE